MSSCLKNCGYIRFSNNIFICSYYNDSKLLVEAVEDVTNMKREIIVYKCDECLEENIIGSNTMEEEARKLKKHLGWMADTFYSFKDTFEESLTEMYRILKKVEEE